MKQPIPLLKFPCLDFINHVSPVLMFWVGNINNPFGTGAYLIPQIYLGLMGGIWASPGSDF